MHVAPGPGTGNAWSTVKRGAERVWSWLASPWTLDAEHAARMVDEGPVGQQLRSLGERSQAHGTTIEVISSQVSDLVRDQGQMRSTIERQSGVIERVEAALGRLAELAELQTRESAEAVQFAAEVRNRLNETRAVPEGVASIRSELTDGIRRVQQTLAEETASLRSRLSGLASSEQVHTLMGQGSVAQELAATRAELSGEIGRMRTALAEQASSMQERLAALPSNDHVQTLIGGGMVVDELASARRELAEEIETTRRALAKEVSALHERLAALASTEQVQSFAGEAEKAGRALAQEAAGIRSLLSQLPSAEQMHTLVGDTVLQEISSTKKQLESAIASVHQALAAETADVHSLLSTLPSAEHVNAAVGGRVAAELAPIRGLLEGLPSAEQLQTLISSGPFAQELSAARAQIADGLHKMQQTLAEHTAGIRERVAALPSTEQVHALVEGGTAANIQSARRFLMEEAQRGQSAAERMTRKLEFLQSRSVIPLTAQGLVMCRNPLGFVAVPADDLATIATLADGVLPEPGTIKAIEKHLKPGGTFVDVGANVGVFTLLAANIVGPSGKVIAIEPAPATARALRATVDANGLSGVVSVKEVAAGAEHGLGTLSVAQNTARSTLLPVEHANGSVVTPIAPLDELLAGAKPDMIKIDVEGFEPKVIEGMRAVLGAHPDLVVIMDFEPAHIRETGLSVATWVDGVLGAGLEIFEIDARNGELSPLRKRGIEEIESMPVLIARSDPSRRAADSKGEGWLKLGAATLPS